MSGSDMQGILAALKHRPFVSLVLICAVGCGGARGSVAGKVTFRGQPVMAGSVVMCGSDKRPATSAIEENGTYSLEDVPVGQVQVAVVSPNPAIAANRSKALAIVAKAKAKAKATDKFDYEAIVPQEASAGSEGPKKRWVRLPKDVEFPDRSGITTTIRPGENTFNIELK
jgi:hypothetical protein